MAERLSKEVLCRRTNVNDPFGRKRDAVTGLLRFPKFRAPHERQQPAFVLAAGAKYFGSCQWRPFLKQKAPRLRRGGKFPINDDRDRGDRIRGRRDWDDRPDWDDDPAGVQAHDHEDARDRFRESGDDENEGDECRRRVDNGDHGVHRTKDRR